MPSTSRAVFDEYGDGPELGPEILKAHYEKLKGTWAEKSEREAKTKEIVPLVLTAFMYSLASIRHLYETGYVEDTRHHNFRALRAASDLIGPKIDRTNLGAHHN